jgi:hypothetical protein
MGKKTGSASSGYLRKGRGGWQRSIGFSGFGRNPYNPSMSKVSAESASPPMMEYLSLSQSNQFAFERGLLVFWEVINGLAIPLGLVIGIFGTIVACDPLWERNLGDNEVWNCSSVEDWVGFLLWCVNAIGFVVVPTLWLVQCERCRRLLKFGNFRGAILAERLCRWAFGFGVVVGTGLCYGFGKALMHGRRHEIGWWIGLLVILYLYGVTLETTRRVMRRAATTSALKRDTTNG